MTEAFDFDFDACARAGRDVTRLMGNLREMMDRCPPSVNGHDIFVFPDQVLEDLKKAHEAIGLAVKKMQSIKFPSHADYAEAAWRAQQRREADMPRTRWG